MRKLKPSLGSIGKLYISMCIAAAGFSAFHGINGFAPKVYADSAKTDMVRVALFIDTGKYSVNTPYVTLSSAKGMDVALRGADGSKPAFTVVDKTTAGVALDGYHALLWEGADKAQAKTIMDKLAAAKQDAVLVTGNKPGAASYQIELGPYASRDAAQAALTKASGLSGISGFIKGYTPSVTGPLHWNAGSYATEAEAAAQAAVIGAAGFDAAVAYLNTAAGAPAYAVFVSAATTSAELSTAKQNINAAIPGLVLQPVDSAAAYIMKRSQIDMESETLAAVPYFMLGGGTEGNSSSKLLVTPQLSDTVSVRERFERSYKGSLEISRFNSKLAVINELPMDQYLASVISSELNKDWPVEALKAQAVAARTYVLKQGVKYQIADVSDSTVDQAYHGAGAEFPAALTAVQATQGEVLKDKNGLISPLFYSNAGGMTAESTEVWGNKVAYLQSVPSPDEGAEKGKAPWYRIVLPNGQTGYIHSSYARDTGEKNAAGLPYYVSTGTGVSVRPAPYVDNASNPATFKVDIGDRFIVFDQAIESNAFSWIRGPFDADKLKDKVNTVLSQPIAGALDKLEISQRGQSGRVTEMKANGQVMKPANPDALRTLFNGLPSTRFDIEETGRYTILGADNTVRSQSAASPAVYVAAGGSEPQAASASQLFILNGDNKAKLVDKKNQYIFRGTGYGHGLGMSQWGARGFAELGYDYKKILQTYYVGVSITKE
ncbi:SpoIID/LytB domain-containing protein [Paenibacillus sp. OAS669]|uniref:SpoIID/LytB domain-containing protein n=1 Tax=Paenibacillus sp. OAS669 TaxID=2663821 RepID=UPI0019D959E2|nr:SpoIID/LytB domain-containing protein [Paenibacillus sp. OAS669]MBE1443445.1 stage II sporulation protein D [Paenibacillus sp. OAS669]